MGPQLECVDDKFTFENLDNKLHEDINYYLQLFLTVVHILFLFTFSKFYSCTYKVRTIACT